MTFISGHPGKTVLLLFWLFLLAAPAQAATMETPARQAILIDYDTGAVLFEKNADEHMPTSSMSKVMTMYLVFEALKNGQISMDDSFSVSEKAWKMGGSKMFVPVGDKVTIEDLVRGVLIQSGNDATVVLAEGLAGSEDAFAAALNKKAGELGMRESHFMNASGWPDPDHYSTARDLATLSRHIIADFPEFYPYFAEKEFTYNKIKQGNRNPLLYRNIGADGIKTGHTEDGGYGMMGSGVAEDGRRVIFVVNGLGDMQERADESARFLQWGLSGFENLRLFKAGETVEDLPVAMGRETVVGIAVPKDITITVPKLFRDELKVEMTYKAPLIAPVSRGDVVGALHIRMPQSEDVMEVPLVAASSVEELGLFAKTLEKAKYFISSGQSDASGEEDTP